MSIASGKMRERGRQRSGKRQRKGGIGRAIGRFAGGLGGGGGGRGRGRGRSRSGRGITGAQLKGFRKVVNLLRKVGMHPKGLTRRVGRKR